MNEDQKRALKRAIYILEVVQEFMGKNWQAAECTFVYDEAECDGHCLGEDAATAAAELQIYFQP